MTQSTTTVIFDDGCPTCQVGMDMAEYLDTANTIEFVGMNTDEGKKLITQHGLDMERSAYAIHDGSIMQKAAFMREVFGRSGIRGWLISLPFRIPYFSDRAYDLLARHRKHRTTTKR